MNQRLLFTIAPYLAVSVLGIGLAWRLMSTRRQGRPSSGGSSALFLERRWRVGIVVVLLVHVLAILFPKGILLWNQHPARLMILEVTGFAFACLALVGLGQGFLARRRSSSVARSAAGDSVCITAVAVSLVSGILVALIHRWGSAWGAATVVPYVYSILRLSPASESVAGLPFLARLHILSGFAVIAAIPFTSIAARLTYRKHLRHEQPA